MSSGGAWCDVPGLDRRCTCSLRLRAHGQGKQARLYFISCERRAIASVQVPAGLEPAQVGGIVKAGIT